MHKDKFSFTEKFCDCMIALGFHQQLLLIQTADTTKIGLEYKIIRKPHKDIQLIIALSPV